MAKNIIIDLFEMTSETVVECDCGSVKRKFQDTDIIGKVVGKCTKCNTNKKINIISKGKIPLFPHLLTIYLKKYGVEYERMDLTGMGGDYVIQNPGVVIERKTVADLLQAWQRGSKKGVSRLGIQIDKCLLSYRNCKVVLLVEDYWMCQYDFHNKCIWVPFYDYEKTSSKGNPIKRTGYYPLRTHPNSLFGKLNSIEMLANKKDHKYYKKVEVVRCAGGLHALDWFITQMSGTEKRKIQMRPSAKRIKPTFTNMDEKRRFFLEGIPSIGPATSKKLIEFYKTPKKALINIHKWQDDLMRITDNAVTETINIVGLKKKKDV